MTDEERMSKKLWWDDNFNRPGGGLSDQVPVLVDSLLDIRNELAGIRMALERMQSSRMGSSLGDDRECG